MTADDESGADPGFWKVGGATLENFQLSRRSRRGNTEGIAGGECEKGGGLNPISLGGSFSGRGPPLPENFQIWVLSPAI